MDGADHAGCRIGVGVRAVGDETLTSVQRTASGHGYTWARRGFIEFRLPGSVRFARDAPRQLIDGMVTDAPRAPASGAVAHPGRPRTAAECRLAAPQGGPSRSGAGQQPAGQDRPGWAEELHGLARWPRW